MRKYLLPADGKPIKANLHCHSTYSDGKYTVEHLKKIYEEKGYGVVAFSDHNRLLPHPELRSDGFVPLTATEIDVNGPEERTYHLNFFSADPDRTEFPEIDRIYGVDGVNEIIRRGNEAGFLCQYNHPRWSLQTPEDFTGLRGLWGFEVFNTGCEVSMCDGWGDYEYEVMCRDGKELPVAVATDDNHNWPVEPGDAGDPYDDSFMGWTTIIAPELSYSAVIDAMKKGNCYATTGPEITGLYVENEKLHVECTPAKAIFIRFERRRSDYRRSNGRDITGAEFDVSGDYRFFRLEIHDGEGNKAMTRAYSRDEIYGNADR